KRNIRIFEKVKNGETTIANASRMVGYGEYNPKPIIDQYFGREDRFWKALDPLTKYLSAWEEKEFKFTHLTPKEAGKRLQKIEELNALLEGAKKDLEARSDNQMLSNRRGY